MSANGMTTTAVIAALQEWPDEGFEVRVQDEDGCVERPVVAVEWCNGPWVIVEAAPVTDDERQGNEAQAALARVEALLDEVDAGNLGGVDWVNRVRDALNGTGP